MVLSGKQRRHLRGLGHSLNPVIQMGKEGISDSFVSAVDQALDDHELIKVKLGQNALVDREDAGKILSERTSSEVAQILGNTILLYRKHPEDPQIKLP